MYISTITQKGQVTIPIAIRKQLGLKTGEKIYFEEKGEDVILKSLSDTVDKLAGSLQTNIIWNKQKAYAAVGRILAQRHINTLK